MEPKLCYNTFKFKEGETLTQTFTRYKALINELRNTNHVKDFELASLFCKLKYEENLIENIYEIEKNKSLVSATPLSTAFISTPIVKDFQDSLDVEEDTGSSYEYLNDLKEEYQARALLAKSKRFFKKGTQRFSSAKATDQTECHKYEKGHLQETTADDTKVSIPGVERPWLSEAEGFIFLNHDTGAELTFEAEELLLSLAIDEDGHLL
nr:hypothetical protein [Tanacetum cinerariifolium]